MLSPHCYLGFSLVAVSGGYSLVVVYRLLVAVASLIVEHRLQEHGLGSCGPQALGHRLSSCGPQA